MSPRLVAIAGSPAGSTFPLEGPVEIGRHSSNGIQLRDLSVSRRHCVIEPREDGLWLRDLESRQGTFVNGVPVRERSLEPGDLILVGTSLFLLQDDTARGEPRGEPSPPAEEESFVAGSTVHLPLEDALYLAPQTERPPDLRVVRDLGALVRIGSVLPTFQAAEPLARRLLEILIEITPAERAALLLLDRGSDEPAVAFHLSRRPRSSAPFRVSRTLTGEAVRRRAAILSNEVVQTWAAHGAESLAAESIRSLICAPLAGVGALYLDTRDDGVRFDDLHLQLVTAVAGMAAPALAATRRMEWLEQERERLDAALGKDMVGESPRMQEIARLIARVAPTDSTVLIRGESGTGKELTARGLHRGSRRAGRPFVAINCATLTDTLLESELFGHERGAFTGAVDRKPGKLELADSGTLFLDEIGEMSPLLQAKLLRVLQEREFERLGGTRTIRVDVRVIAATNRDLEAAMKSGAFREDLFYRLNVITLNLPPLRERREDVPLLASHFAAALSRKLGRPVAGFAPETRACLLRYSWPGNVRELANAVERAMVLGSEDLIRPEDLPETVTESVTSGAPVPVSSFHEAVNEQKRRLVLAAVEQSGGNITRAAELLGLHPNYLHRLIGNLDLRARIKASPIG
ncbi:MAG TPA: sigma 54-interacting transcriptional regulator [Thermoanaerobaculia bacterium]|nr:sigma 54-interacting transcriptional regulator [Thermoanaerobaculia bacterium]